LLGNREEMQAIFGDDAFDRGLDLWGWAAREAVRVDANLVNAALTEPD
jgi:hypothetical protein